MKESIIVFKKIHLEFLITHISRTSLLLSKCLEAYDKGKYYENDYPTNRYLIAFSNHEIEIILDELVFLLTSIGFNQNDEPNDLGLIVEDIIDLFSVHI